MHCSGTTGQAVLQSGCGLWGQTRKWSHAVDGCSLFGCYQDLQGFPILQGGAWEVREASDTIGHLSIGNSSDWTWPCQQELLRAIPYSHRTDDLLWRAWRSGMMSWLRLDDKRKGMQGVSSSIGFDWVKQHTTDLWGPCEPDHTLSWVNRHVPDGAYFQNEAAIRLL